ncbi:MAG: hypothetical protein ACR2LN_04170 [Candidatus Levyibacteriota bacterium]
MSEVRNKLTNTLYNKIKTGPLPSSESGQMLVELVMAIGMAAIILPALLTGLVASREGRPQQQQREQATALLKETVNAVQNIRDSNWTSFAIDGTFHPIISTNKWIFAANAGTVNGFTQQVVISDVYRDTSGAITLSGGTLDPSTKKIVATISWSQPQVASVSATRYMTRTTNLTYSETTQIQFNAGTKTGVVVAATVPSVTPGDGEVELGSGGGFGNWCSPGNSVVKTFDLPGSGVTQSIAATSSATQDVAYTTTGGNASGDAVDGLTITHDSTPIVTNPSLNNEAKAYGIYVDNSASYVYFNENNPPNHTVRIANASNLSDVGYFDASGVKANSVFVSGNTGYTTGGSTLYSFDVSSKTGSRSQLGSVSLGGTGKRVVVVGTNAYVATSNTTGQLQIINVANPSSMTVTKTINVGNGLGGVDVYVNSSQTYAYLVTSYSAGQKDFYIIDLNNTNNIWGYTTVNGMNPKGITIVTGNRAILVGSGGEEYEVFDITSPSAASHCGGMSPSGVTSVNAVAPILQSNGNAYSYIITDNASAEFQIIQGGNGGQFSSSGSFVSATFDPTSVDGGTNNRSFNRFIADVNQPSITTIKMQAAVAGVGSSGTCSDATFAFAGPDGTTSSYFTPSGSTITGLIPLLTSGNYQNPGRCFRYKVYFNSPDTSQTPVFQDINLNYSP